MEKLLKAISRLISTFSISVLFILISFFALKQSFGVSLVIMISLLIAQIILSVKFKKNYGWSYWGDFTLAGRSNKEVRLILKSITFNVAKVIVLFHLLKLIYNNFLNELNPFGALGQTILVCVILLLSIIWLFEKNVGNYKKFRGVLAIIMFCVIISFIYLCFGTQLVWIPICGFLIFAVGFQGFGDLEDNINGAEETLIISLVAMALAAVVGTLIQFWTGIAYFFVTIWAFLVKIGMYKFIPGGYVWEVILVLAIVGIVVLIGIYAGRRNLAKREHAKLQEETKKILAKEKLQREEQLKDRKIKEEEEKQKEKLFVEKTWKEIAALEEVLEKREINMKELLYISSVYSRFDCLSRFKVKHLTAIPLKDYFVISLVKKQIVWPASFTALLNMYGFLYTKNYEDGDLKLIISILNDLLTYLGEYKEFTGYKEIEKLIQKTEIPLTWEK